MCQCHREIRVPSANASSETSAPFGYHRVPIHYSNVRVTALRFAIIPASCQTCQSAAAPASEKQPCPLPTTTTTTAYRVPPSSASTPGRGRRELWHICGRGSTYLTTLRRVGETFLGASRRGHTVSNEDPTYTRARTIVRGRDRTFLMSSLRAGHRLDPSRR